VAVSERVQVDVVVLAAADVAEEVVAAVAVRVDAAVVVEHAVA